MVKKPKINKNKKGDNKMIKKKLRDITKGVQTKTIMAYEILEEQEKYDFDVEELEIFLKSKTNI